MDCHCPQCMEHLTVVNTVTPPTTDWVDVNDNWGTKLGDLLEKHRHISSNVGAEIYDLIEKSHTDLARTIRDDLMGKLDTIEITDGQVIKAAGRIGVKEQFAYNQAVNNVQDEIKSYFKDRFNVWV